MKPSDTPSVSAHYLRGKLEAKEKMIRTALLHLQAKGNTSQARIVDSTQSTLTNDNSIHLQKSQRDLHNRLRETQNELARANRFITSLNQSRAYQLMMKTLRLLGRVR